MIWTRILGIAHFEVIPVSEGRVELDKWFKQGRPCTDTEAVRISRSRMLKHEPLRVEELIKIHGCLHGYDNFNYTMEWFKEKCERAIEECDAVLYQAILVISRALRGASLLVYAPSIGWRRENYSWCS